jgi:hypothetical protein
VAEHQELVSAQPDGKIVLPGHSSQQRPEPAQQLIAHGVTEDVVDDLDMVDVHHDDGDLAVHAVCSDAAQVTLVGPPPQLCLAVGWDGAARSSWAERPGVSGSWAIAPSSACTA